MKSAKRESWWGSNLCSNKSQAVVSITFSFILWVVIVDQWLSSPVVIWTYGDSKCPDMAWTALYIRHGPCHQIYGLICWLGPLLFYRNHPPISINLFQLLAPRLFLCPPKFFSLRQLCYVTLIPPIYVTPQVASPTWLYPNKSLLASYMRETKITTKVILVALPSLIVYYYYYYIKKQGLSKLKSLL